MGSGEQIVMTLQQMAALFHRPLNTLQYWAWRRGMRRLFRDETGTYYPLDEFRLLHERRRRWRGRKP